MIALWSLIVGRICLRRRVVYDLCESFLAGLTRGGDANIKYQNKDLGKVVWRGVVRCTPVLVGIGSPTGSYWQFEIVIEVKDNKIRYTISDFQLQYEPDNGYYAGKRSVESLYGDSLKMGSKKLMKLHNGSFDCLDRDVNGLIKSLNDHLLSAKLPKNDW